MTKELQIYNQFVLNPRIEKCDLIYVSQSDICVYMYTSNESTLPMNLHIVEIIFSNIHI